MPKSLRLCCISRQHFLAGASGWENRWDGLCQDVLAMGFNAVLLPALWEDDADQANPQWFAAASTTQVVSRMVSSKHCHALALILDLRINHVSSDELHQWVVRLQQWVHAGVAGFRCLGLGDVPAKDWRQLVSAVRGQDMAENSRQTLFLAWTPGLTVVQLADLSGIGFDGVFSSFPWWNGRASWLVQEYQRLSRLAPVIAPVVDLDAADVQDVAVFADNAGRLLARMQMAAFTATGLAMPLELARQAGQHVMQILNSGLEMPLATDMQLSILSGPLAETTVLLRHYPGVDYGLLALINPDDQQQAVVDESTVRQRLPGRFYLELSVGGHVLPEFLAPGAILTLPVQAVPSAALHEQASKVKPDHADSALQAGRIVIEHIRPAVDDGRFPVKRIPGQAVRVQADVYMDGHDELDAEVLWKALDAAAWRSVPMQKMDNDTWQAVFYTDTPGQYCYTVRAWRNGWRSHHVAMRKKQEAGQDITLDKIEAALMDGPDERSFETQADTVFPLLVERREAQFASWYELFPRSLSSVPGQHGTFRDVEQRLAAIRDMGFDVLYFPPIHPIGKRNRKGRNNALQAGPTDPGSPYAIGSQAGGHDAVHPELGTLDDFRHLLRAAHDHDMEIALDFAIQCSPDHPWLAQHPEWFDWRADGSLHYAENPPKRYEDIVNPDFYSPQANDQQRTGLWRALRDTVLFWAEQGVRTFRVDNPHTKPLPFWEWLLHDVQQRYPDTIFLSEAFTRPKMMYRLAKVGFSLSYTYFIWRNNKQELTDYLNELNTPPVADFFRPNFFVNTPDINPYFLQQSGRAGFLIRAALAATLSGVWGMYNGFEVCVSQPVPGREEYADSEKYELRHWDMTQPGNIVAEITRLNQIRRENPALQSHLGLRFHDADNSQVLFFSKSTDTGDSVVLVAISLNPQAEEHSLLHFPWWLFSLPNNAPWLLRQLYDDTVFTLGSNEFYVHLTPERPFALWRLESGDNRQNSYGKVNG